MSRPDQEPDQARVRQDKSRTRPGHDISDKMNGAATGRTRARQDKDRTKQRLDQRHCKTRTCQIKGRAWAREDKRRAGHIIVKQHKSRGRAGQDKDWTRPGRAEAGQLRARPSAGQDEDRRRQGLKKARTISEPVKLRLEKSYTRPGPEKRRPDTSLTTQEPGTKGRARQGPDNARV